jgi:hypothetical protein
MSQHEDDDAGNRCLATYLWGYRYRARARRLRCLVVFFADLGVTDQDALARWAATAEFKRDFRGKVGLRGCPGKVASSPG